MPQTPHIEKHFTATETVRDVVIGMMDGLTVPFELAAGLSGAVAVSGLIVKAGLAEIAAGSIAMGLGGYLAARSDAEHYVRERRREQQEVRALTIAGAYVAGGFIPLGPYLLIARKSTALMWSVAVTLFALLVFGYIKGRLTGTGPLRGAVQTMLIGCLAAAAAFLIARAIS